MCTLKYVFLFYFFHGKVHYFLTYCRMSIIIYYGGFESNTIIDYGVVAVFDSY